MCKHTALTNYYLVFAAQLAKHPSIVPVDFDFERKSGKLQLNIPQEPAKHDVLVTSDSYELQSSDQDQQDQNFNIYKPDTSVKPQVSDFPPVQEPDYVNLSSELLREVT